MENMTKARFMGKGEIAPPCTATTTTVAVAVAMTLNLLLVASVLSMLRDGLARKRGAAVA